MMELKAGSNWRQIFKGPEIEVCTASKFGTFFPHYAKHFEIFEKLTNISLKCPLQAGPYYLMNYTDKVQGKTTKMNNDDKIGVGIDIPNGIYRYTIKLFTKQDPLGFFVQWRTEIRDRLAEEDF
jgi:hypothetical protein